MELHLALWMKNVDLDWRRTGAFISYTSTAYGTLNFHAKKYTGYSASSNPISRSCIPSFMYAIASSSISQEFQRVSEMDSILRITVKSQVFLQNIGTLPKPILLADSSK
jgi:hypothetical protein